MWTHEFFKHAIVLRGRCGNIFDDKGKGATFIEEKSFRLKSLTDLRRCIKNKQVQFESAASYDVILKKKLKERATGYSHLVIHYTPMDSTYFSSDVLVLCRLSRMPSLKQIASVKMTRVRSQSHWIALPTKKCAVYTSKCISLLLYNNPFWKLKLDRDKTSALCNMVIH